MLIEFSVTNFRCIREKMTLSLVASADRHDRDLHVFPAENGKLNLLSAAAVYGPNAAGKSTLIKALHMMQRMVMGSAKDSQEGEPIEAFQPFLLAEQTRNGPGEFEVVFIQNQVRYQYGFSLDRHRIHGEWLFASPEGHTQQWFQRNYDPDRDETTWYFGPNFKGPKKIYQASTRANALFLSTAIMLNNAPLKPVFEWFQNHLRVLPSNHLYPGFTIKLIMERDRKQDILKFMKALDLNFLDIQVEKISPEKISFPPQLKAEEKEQFLALFKDGLLEAKFFQQIPGEEAYPLDLLDLSEGSQKLFGLAGPLFDILEKGMVLFVDELHNSLHHAATEFLIKLFRLKTNPHHAQLLFSTHDTSFLHAKHLRRDQIWFLERLGEDLSSKLTPLSDIHARKNEQFEKSYLNGRYGALPFLGSLD